MAIMLCAQDTLQAPCDAATTVFCAPTGNDQDEYGFERGSRKVYELDIETELGTLQCVKVQQVWPSSASAMGNPTVIRKVDVFQIPCHRSYKGIPSLSMSMNHPVAASSVFL